MTALSPIDLQAARVSDLWKRVNGFACGWEQALEHFPYDPVVDGFKTQLAHLVSMYLPLVRGAMGSKVWRWYDGELQAGVLVTTWACTGPMAGYFGMLVNWGDGEEATETWHPW